MADGAAQVRRVVSRLRARGFTVHEVAGWETRGSGAMITRGRIEHHTATPRSAAGDAPTLRVVTYGHGTLRNSLSRWYVSRSGVIYLVALRTSWHAGAGVKGTNATLSGTEAEHSGTTGEAWGARSLDAQAAISQEECREFGVPTSRVWEHKEHAPSRKIDRISITGASWRSRLARATPTPPPAPIPPKEFIVATRAELRADLAAATAHLATTDEVTRIRNLAYAATCEAVARIRRDLDWPDDPRSDAVQASRIQAGDYDLAYVKGLLTSIALRRQAAMPDSRADDERWARRISSGSHTLADLREAIESAVMEGR